MAQKKLNPILIGLLLLIYVLVDGIALAQGAVVCVEKNGEVTLELSMDGNCANSLASTYQPSRNSLSNLSHCPGCTDIPLSIHHDQGVLDYSPVNEFTPNKPLSINIHTFLVRRYLATATLSQASNPPPKPSNALQLMSISRLLL